MEATVMLIPSPLLGPATWESTAHALEREGRQAQVPSLQGVAHSAAPYWPAGVEAEQSRMPAAYYDHLPPAADGWDDGVQCAYIWFAEPYDTGVEQAHAHNWPTRHLPGHHLHMLVDPDAVAAAVLDMADRHG
jgi:hypothetical protein